MVTGAAYQSLASQARRLYTEEIAKGLPSVIQTVCEHAQALMDKPADSATIMRRRDLVQTLLKVAAPWHRQTVRALRDALDYGVSASRIGELPFPGTMAGMTLVDDDTIELEIMTSRLALAIMDRASWEFSDLRARIAHLEKRTEIDPQDLLRAHVLSRVVVDAWRASGLPQSGWRDLQEVVHREFAQLIEEAYHEANRWLMERHVLPEVDLRPLIKRQYGRPSVTGFDFLRTGAEPSTGGGGSGGGFGGGSGGGSGPPVAGGTWTDAVAAGARGNVGEETRMMTQPVPLPRRSEHVEAVLGRLNRLVGRYVPGFAATGVVAPRPMSSGLAKAIDAAQGGVYPGGPPGVPGGAPGVPRVTGRATTPMLLEDLKQRTQALKRAAATPEERATIEIVALLFQSILTEDRIPASIRVWFARLQMPVLRVAVSEPDFFAAIDHPARRLIDRMGACVMGFDTAAAVANVTEALQKEIKRIVQVVEAYPDTGRRVFQTVLTEFEKFLEHYFKNENETTRKGVSLAQQVEQRETLAIQYTIELRRMLNEVPVQDGVREFLFQVWADVLATTAVRFGAQSDAARAMKRAAADLIGSASAKVSREERSEVIQRLPALLKSLREGMSAAGLDAQRQEAQIRQLNDALAAAFTAKAAVIPQERLKELMVRLETLEELLPEADDVVVDESMVLDLSGHESAGLEVVVDGGSMPSQAMQAWARELQVGSWFMLDYRDRNEAVQLVWHGLRKQLSLFVSARGRCVLFQQHRLASFLQAGLLLPAQDEALTVRASRDALARLDADPASIDE